MRHALFLARRHMEAGHGGPFGAIVVRGDRVVAEGFNRVTSSNDPTAHAEIEAIRGACAALDSYALQGCELYSSCEPCPMCLGAIYWARLDRVWYAGSRQDAAVAGFDDAFIYGELDLPMAQRRIPFQRILADESAALFEAWLAKPDRVPY